jgi:glycine/D-amino acid oxidase-like deaminating enzyme
MNPPRGAGVVVCGAGVAGLATAWHLAVRRGVADVVIVDDQPPLTVTSDKSTECYRNWWPDRPMVELMNRSIELLDELAEATGNAFALNRNGYLFATATREGAAALEREARAVAAAGAGPLRVRRGGSLEPGAAAWAEPHWDRPRASAEGADLFLDAAEIRRRFPVLAPDTLAALHTRRCGWLSAQQLGMLLLEQARAAGARLVAGRVVGVELADGAVAAVRVARGAGAPVERIATPAFVDAAGPWAGEVARLVGVELPLFHELHCKVTFDDERGVLPRELPLVCWRDAVTVDWSPEEREGLAEDPATRALVGVLPAGVHFRPEGGRDSRAAILLWNYRSDPVEPRFPIRPDPLHFQVVLRGVARAAPAFAVYLAGGRVPYVDGGYYTKTRENRPLIGPLDPEGARGAFLVGALSGFGIMAAPAAGELAAAYLAGDPVPEWAGAFRLERYDDPAYRAALLASASGQL